MKQGSLLLVCEQVCYPVSVLQVGYAELARRFVARDKQAVTAGLPPHVMTKGTRNTAGPSDSGKPHVRVAQADSLREPGHQAWVLPGMLQGWKSWQATWCIWHPPEWYVASGQSVQAKEC